MASTYTTRIGLEKYGYGDYPGTWQTRLNAASDLIDSLSAVGSLAVRLAEVPSSTLNVSVASGSFRASTGLITNYAGISSFAVAASTTTCLWLTDAGVLASGTAFPADTVIAVRLATIVAGASTVTSITDARVPWQSAGAPLTAGANQAAITDSSGGTPSFTIAAISDAPTANAIASLARQVAAIRTALIATGQIKGSA